ncbi:MAG: thiaminase II, partial [Rhodospirillaceae bacterium]|nr:thiaminase II [Rhodospirillaceae bacterium]
IDQMNQLEKLAAGRGGEERFTNLSKTFNQATRLEINFWEMGLNAE